MDDLQNDAAFTKKIFRYLVNNGTVSGKELCLALYDQNILAYDENEVRMLEAGGDEYAFQFIRNKISDIEITPAQLALDPCSASAVITEDVYKRQVHFPAHKPADHPDTFPSGGGPLKAPHEGVYGHWVRDRTVRRK